MIYVCLKSVRLKHHSILYKCLKLLVKGVIILVHCLCGDKDCLNRNVCDVLKNDGLISNERHLLCNGVGTCVLVTLWSEVGLVTGWVSFTTAEVVPVDFVLLRRKVSWFFSVIWCPTISSDEEGKGKKGRLFLDTGPASAKLLRWDVDALTRSTTRISLAADRKDLHLRRDEVEIYCVVSMLVNRSTAASVRWKISSKCRIFPITSIKPTE